MLGTGAILPRIASAANDESSSDAVLSSDRPYTPYVYADPENVIHSVCLQCNTGCGIKLQEAC